MVARIAALHINQLVAQADVAEGASHHHFVVAATSTERIEVGRPDPVGNEILAGRTVGLDGSGWRNVVGGDEVAKHAEDSGIDDIGQRGGGSGGAIHPGGLLNVGRVVVPGVDTAAIGRQLAPDRAGRVGVAVEFLIERRVVGGGDQRFDLLWRGPDIGEVDRFAIAAGADGGGGQVDVDRAGQRVGDHEGRAAEVVGLREGMHSPFEVAVATQNRPGNEVVLFDGGGDIGGQRSAVPDTGGAAIADDLEAQGVEACLQVGLLEEFPGDTGAGGETGLDEAGHRQPAGDGLACHDARTEQERGVGGVGAACDGGNHDGPMGQRALPGEIDGRWHRIGRQTKTALFLRNRQRLVERVLQVADPEPVLGTFRAGNGCLHAREIQLEYVGVSGLTCVIAEEPLRLAVALHQVDLLLAAAGIAQVFQRGIVDREESHRGPVFRCHVGQRRAVGQSQTVQSFSEEFDEVPHDAILAQHRDHGQGRIRGGDAGLQGTSQLDAGHDGRKNRNGLSQHGGLGFDAADAPAQYAHAVDRRGVRVGADDAVGEGHVHAILLAGRHAGGQHFHVDLVADAHAGRYDIECVERLLSPLEKGVAFVVALEFDLHVAVHGRGAAGGFDLQRVVDYQIDRDGGLDLVGVAAHALHLTAQHGQVDDAGHAGEILQQDAGGHQGEFFTGSLGGPGGELGHVRLGEGRVRLLPQQLFQ